MGEKKGTQGRENFATSRDEAKDDRKSEKNHSREDEFQPGGWMPTPRNFRRRAREELSPYHAELAVASVSQLPDCP
jgi:hypothetical protein